MHELRLYGQGQKRQRYRDDIKEPEAPPHQRGEPDQEKHGINCMDQSEEFEPGSGVALQKMLIVQLGSKLMIASSD